MLRLQGGMRGMADRVVGTNEMTSSDLRSYHSESELSGSFRRCLIIYE